MMKQEWILCPICGNKTRDRIREDTVLKNYPLYCPKCKHESLIEAEGLQINVVMMADKPSNLHWLEEENEIHLSKRAI